MSTTFTPDANPTTSILVTITEELLHELLEDTHADKDSEPLKRKKDWLLGSRQSLLDAIIALSQLEMKRREHQQKMQADKPVAQNLDKDDMRIIEQFLKEHATRPEQKITCDADQVGVIPESELLCKRSAQPSNADIRDTSLDAVIGEKTCYAPLAAATGSRVGSSDAIAMAMPPEGTG